MPTAKTTSVIAAATLLAGIGVGLALRGRSPDVLAGGVPRPEPGTPGRSPHAQAVPVERGDPTTGAPAPPSGSSTSAASAQRARGPVPDDGPNGGDRSDAEDIRLGPLYPLSEESVRKHFLPGSDDWFVARAGHFVDGGQDAFVERAVKQRAASAAWRLGESLWEAARTPAEDAFRYSAAERYAVLRAHVERLEQFPRKAPDRDAFKEVWMDTYRRLLQLRHDESRKFQVILKGCPRGLYQPPEAYRRSGRDDVYTVGGPIFRNDN